uniref:USP domain-containing protein n=1 Tax=viral metagenome TaxID=1070528 RepID=A0A6C0JUX4_9ZZZZ
MNPNTFQKYNGFGKTGLSNVGNSCYINSCIQCLSHTYELNELLDSLDILACKPGPDTTILYEWDILRKMMWKQNCNITPGSFIRAIHHVAYAKQNTMFSGYQQNDIQEFLLFLMDCIHTSIARKVVMNVTGTTTSELDDLAKSCYEMMTQMYSNNYSEIIQLFYGIHVTVLESVTNGSRLSIKPEPFFILSLYLPLNKENPTLYDCIDEFCKVERLEGENAWWNDSINQKQNVDKRLLFWSFPDIFIIHLNRLTNDGNKDTRKMMFPLKDLNLTQYVKGYNKQSSIYDLYGVCEHSGDLFHGHYISKIRISDGQWYTFNDLNVSPIDENNVIDSNAYCLFYRKKK